MRAAKSKGLDITARIANALELREQEGLTWAAIADRLGAGVRTAALKVQAERRAAKGSA